MAANKRGNKSISEEEYVLRVRDPDLAKRIRSSLRAENDTTKSKLEIIFTDSNVSGVLRFEGNDYQLTVLNLPTVTECYKTYDDVNLVKTGDIGQVLVVGPITEGEAQGEVRDGITPPMRNARERVFRKPIDATPINVAHVENQILDILNGGAPQGFRFVDHEEVWEVDPATKLGRWVPTKK